MMAADDRPAQRNTSLLRTVRTVAWAMFGVRNTQQHRNDEQALRPLQVVGVGLVALTRISRPWSGASRCQPGGGKSLRIAASLLRWPWTIPGFQPHHGEVERAAMACPRVNAGLV